MIRPDEFHLEIPQCHRVAVLHDMARHCVHHIVLGQLALNEAHGKPRRVNRHVDLLQYIRDRADVVLVSVGDDESLHLLQVFFQECRVRQHQVDAKHVVLRERQTAVDHDDRITVLECGHIHTDLLKPPKRYDAHWQMLVFRTLHLRLSAGAAAHRCHFRAIRSHNLPRIFLFGFLHSFFCRLRLFFLCGGFGSVGFSSDSSLSLRLFVRLRLFPAGGFLLPGRISLCLHGTGAPVFCLAPASAVGLYNRFSGFFFFLVFVFFVH